MTKHDDLGDTEQLDLKNILELELQRFTDQ